MSFIIRKAQRQKAKLRLGISAPSGCGKTLGALMLAYGITKDWSKIGVIDTEQGSGELYVGAEEHGIKIGEFIYGRIETPFEPKKYLEGIKALEQAGCEVIIIDSLSHAWAGSGGLLDKHGKITDSSRSGNSWTAWRTVTPEHNALVDAMLQSSAHIIATMRSKVEYVQTIGGDGKAKIEKMGLAPVQREGMEYEFTVFFDIREGSRCTASKDRTKLFSKINAASVLEKDDFIITPQTGEKILAWLETGEQPIDDKSLLLESIKELLATLELNENVAGDKWLIDNKDNLSIQNGEKLSNILTYLKGKKHD